MGSVVASSLLVELPVVDFRSIVVLTVDISRVGDIVLEVVIEYVVDSGIVRVWEIEVRSFSVVSGL